MIVTKRLRYFILSDQNKLVVFSSFPATEFREEFYNGWQLVITTTLCTVQMLYALYLESLADEHLSCWNHTYTLIKKKTKCSSFIRKFCQLWGRGSYTVFEEMSKYLSIHEEADKKEILFSFLSVQQTIMNSRPSLFILAWQDANQVHCYSLWPLCSELLQTVYPTVPSPVKHWEKKVGCKSTHEVHPKANWKK